MSDEEGESRIYFPLGWKAKLFSVPHLAFFSAASEKGGTNRRGRGLRAVKKLRWKRDW